MAIVRMKIQIVLFFERRRVKSGGGLGDKRGETPQGQDEEKELIPVGDRHDGFGSQ